MAEEPGPPVYDGSSGPATSGVQSAVVSVLSLCAGGWSPAEASSLMVSGGNLGVSGGLGDSGAPRLWRLAGWGGSGGGTAGARTDPLTVRRGMTLGMAVLSGTGGF